MSRQRTKKMSSRRRFLQGAFGAAAALPFAGLLGGHRASGQTGARAQRLLVYYFPDGVPGRSQNGEGSLWEASADGGRVVLPEALQPLAGLEEYCTFVNGLTMGGADDGSHPGGAKKLLTGVDGGNGKSIDRALAETAGAGATHPHVYLGAMANHNSASGDKHISYLNAGYTVPPEDDPHNAFRRLFGGPMPTTPSEGGGEPVWNPRRSILDVSAQEVAALRGRLGARERMKLDLHTDSIRELERRLADDPMLPAMVTPPSCESPAVGLGEVDSTRLYEPERFGAIQRAQIDILVNAMACGQTRVGVLQNSHHTSELIMSRIPGTEMHDPGFDIRSHQASHYGASHDRGNRNFTAFVQQRRYWVQEFAYLLEQLRSRPEGDGNMLDYTTVLLCSEVSDGNTHSHSDMPFIVAGGGGGTLSGGRVLNVHGRSHGELLLGLAHSLGQRWDSFGQGGWEPLPGLLVG